jgi:hypothetical protein
MAVDADYVYNGTTVTDAGTAASSPLITDLPIPDAVVHTFRVRMPPGPCGNLGWAFYNADSQIMPYSITESWVTGDDEVWEFDYEQEVGSQLVLWTYNTGSNNHELLYQIVYTPVAAVTSTVAESVVVSTVAEVTTLPEENVFQIPGDAVGA